MNFSKKGFIFLFFGTLIFAWSFFPLSVSPASTDGCTQETKYFYEECLRRRSDSNHGWNSDKSLEVKCKEEANDIEARCENQYNVSSSNNDQKKTTSEQEPYIIPSTPDTSKKNIRNAETCSFGNLLDRMHNRTSETKQQVIIRDQFLTTLNKQDFSKSIITLSQIEEKLSELVLKINQSKVVLESETIPQVDLFLKKMGYGSNQDKIDPSASLKIDELLLISPTERKNAADYLLLFDANKSDTESTYNNILASIKTYEIDEDTRLGLVKNLTQSLKASTEKTIQTTLDFAPYFPNKDLIFSYNLDFTPDELSQNKTMEMVKNIHLISMTSNKAMDLSIDTQKDQVYTPSLGFPISTDALNLSEEVKYRSDFNSNIIDFDKCSGFNDLSNSGNAQESHLLRNLLMSMQATILAARLTESRSVMHELNTWSQQFVDQEKNVKEKKIKIYQTLLQAEEFLKSVYDIQGNYAKAWKKLIDMIEVKAQICSQNPSPLSDCPSDPVAILTEAKTNQIEVDAYKATVKQLQDKNQLAITQLQKRLEQSRNFGDIALTPTTLPKTATFRQKILKIATNIILKIRTIPSLISTVLAQPQAETPLHIALGLTSNSRYKNFFNQSRTYHLNLMTGKDPTRPDYDLSKLEKRTKYLELVSAFSKSSYLDMAERTYTSALIQSEKNAQILAGINHDKLKGFADDLNNRYQSTIMRILPHLKSLSAQSLKNILSSDLSKLISDQNSFSKKLRDLRRKELNLIKKMSKSNTTPVKDFETLSESSSQMLKQVMAQANQYIAANLLSTHPTTSIAEIKFLNLVKDLPISQISSNGIKTSENTMLKDEASSLAPKRLEIVEPTVETPVVLLGNIKPEIIHQTLKSDPKPQETPSIKIKDQEIFYQDVNEKHLNNKLNTKKSYHEQTLWEIISEIYNKKATGLNAQ